MRPNSMTYCQETCKCAFVCLTSISLLQPHDSSAISFRLIIGAQVLVAGQIIYEEKVLTKYDIPILHVLGLEGLFGSGLMSVLLIGMYFIPVGPQFGQENPRQVMEDALDGMFQVNRVL